MKKKPFNFVNLIFTRKKAEENKIRFGRFSDRNKTNEQLLALHQADKLFEEGNCIEGIIKFFEFLKDSKYGNIKYEETNKKVKFSFFQGSKKIKGYLCNGKIYAYSELIKLQKDNDELFKILLNMNYKMKFSKFSLDKGIIKIEQNQFTKKNSPESLYYSLREMAIIADRYDDYLEMKFEDAEIINKSHIVELEEREFEVKSKYFYDLLQTTFEQVDSLDTVKFAGARAFILMNSVFKILYLLSPEGILLENLKNIYDFYYTEDNKTQVEKTAFVYSRLNALKKLSIVELKHSLYYVLYTFPEVLPTESTEFINFVKDEIQKIFWYESNEYKNVAQAILEYIVGYSCFSFGTIPVVKELLSIFWQVMNKKFFDDLEIKDLPFEKDKISFFFLMQKVSSINSAASHIYPKFFFNIKHLNLDNRFEFAKSFIYEMINLNFSQTDENE